MALPPRDSRGRFTGNSITVAIEVDGRGLDQAARNVRTLGRTVETSLTSSFNRAEHAASRFTGFLRQASSTAAGFLSANIISNAFSRAESALESFGQKVVDATVEASDAQRFLRSAVEETHGSLAAAEAQALAFGKAMGLSESAAKRLFASATVGLEGTGKQAGQFLAAAADLAAARGIAASELGTIITQIFNGADEGLGRLFAGKNPSTFFNEYARAAGRTADSLSDVERRQILVNAVIQAAAKHAGEAASRTSTLGGALERASALFTDVAARVGDALGRNVGVLKIAEQASAFFGKFATDQGAVDAVMQKIADGFVLGANRALDFAKIAAHGVNGTIGAFKKMGIVVKQLILDLQITVREFWEAFQGLTAIGIQNTLQGVKALAVAVVNGVQGILTDIVSKTRAALEVAAASGLPGAGEALTQVRNLEQFLSQGAGTSDLVTKGFDAANASLNEWIERVQKSHEVTEDLKDELADLGKGYTAIDKQTAAANASTDAFFEGIRSQLPDFAKFNAPPEQTVTVTKLIQEGDSLTGFPVQVAAASDAAKATTAAVNDMNGQTATLLDTIKELPGGIGTLEGAITGLASKFDKGAIIKVLAGSGLTIDEVAPSHGNVP